MLGNINLRTIVYLSVGLLVLWLLVRILMPSQGPVDTEELSSANLEQSRETPMVSSVQPIPSASSSSQSTQAISGNLFVADVEAAPSLTKESSNQLKELFADALNYQKTGNEALAIKSYQNLIARYPYTPEAYINLAALIGAEGDLDAAKEILQQGINKNQQAALLLQSLSRVNALKAAKAYRQALDVNSEPEQLNQTKLPIADRIISQADLRDQIVSLQSRLNETLASNSGAEELIQQYQSRISKLERDLQAATAKNSSDREQLARIQSLQAELSKSAEALSKSEAAEREALARVVRAEQDAATKIAEADAMVLELKKQISQFESGNVVAATTSAAPKPSAEPTSSALMTSNNRSQAIARVKSWAEAWSNKNVEEYTSHYESGYSSSSSLTHNQWLEQRRVRLTNKSFIDVAVSDFSINDLGDKFAVTFRQHYRSDVIDDVVRKRLTFAKKGQDWSEGKIINERLVR